MNQDQIRGLWGQLKGRAKIAFGDLTDDEGRRVEGTTDALYGRMQQKFGDAKQAVRRVIDRSRMP